MNRERRVEGEERDLIDRRMLNQAVDDLVWAVGKSWGAGSVEHNLVRDIRDIIERVPAANAPAQNEGVGS